MWLVLLILMGLYFLVGIGSHLCTIFAYFEDKDSEDDDKKYTYKPNDYKSSKYKLEE